VIPRSTTDAHAGRPTSDSAASALLRHVGPPCTSSWVITLRGGVG
jgi:hypothetical protein